MATCTFDQLLYALRVSVESANDALRHRRAMHYETDRAEERAFHVGFAEGGGPGDSLGDVVIPLGWFRDPRCPLVTEFSMAFDCRLYYSAAGKTRRELLIDMRSPGRTWWRRRPTHRLCISLRAVDQWKPQVVLDGRVVDVPVGMNR